MTYKGTVAGGVVVPQRGVQLPEGADVRIQLVKRAKRRKPKIMRHAGAAKSTWVRWKRWRHAESRSTRA